MISRFDGRWVALGVLLGLLLLVLSLPASAQDSSGSPTLSVSDRLEDRRYVATGTRAYVAGTEDGLFPAMGFHTRGEMGGVWAPPIKLLDGLWFGIGEDWIGPAEEFTSGYGHVKMDLPDRDGLSVERTDFVPDGKRAVLVGLTFESDDARTIDLKMDAHSELMGAYPWGETTPNQKDHNLEDTVAVEDGKLVFRERGKPPAQNARPHDWAAVVGSGLTPTGSETGEDYRGPQDPAVICPASGPNTPPAPPRCDDTEYGEGKGGQLRYTVRVPADRERTVWFAVSGADFDGKSPTGAKAAALRTNASALENPAGQLEEKISSRTDLAKKTRLDLPGDRLLQQSIKWSKQNLADSVQIARDLEIRETNAGTNYPPPEGDLDRMRFLGAGFPDYQWLFGTDGEFTAFASVGVGQFGPIKDHLRALKEVSEIDNGRSGKVVHEVVTDGTVFFGSNADAGNTDETSKFPSAVALLWRWTGDDGFRDEMYGFTKRNMKYVFRKLDRDGDLWPEGLGNVERPGMGEEKLDNTTSTIRGLYDLADMARSKGDKETERWAEKRADAMMRKFERAWWMPEVPQHADSLDQPPVGGANEKIQQRHWIGTTPMEIELVDDKNRVVPGMTTLEHGNAALDLRETSCYTDPQFGLYHTGTPGCDPAQSTVPAEKNVFTLNTAIAAVGEGNYGRLGEGQQQLYTDANANLQFEPDEQPGAMPEIAISNEGQRSIERPFNERPMVLQAWGAYGTIWPVVHQQLGVRPDLGRDRLEVVPQLPSDSPISGENIRLGRGSIAVSAQRDDDAYTTTVDPDVRLDELTIGHTVPRDAKVRSAELNGRKVRHEVRETNRGKEVLVDAPTDGEQELVVKTR